MGSHPRKDLLPRPLRCSHGREEVADSLQAQMLWEDWFLVLAPPGSQYDQ